MLHILDALTQRGAAFRSLGDSWADTTAPHGRLMLTVLGGLAEFERGLINARIGEGRTRAKARGVHMGRPPKLTSRQRREALQALADGTASQAEQARCFNASYIAKAERALREAQALLQQAATEGACSRAYYAMFDAAHAALIATSHKLPATPIKVIIR